MHVYMYLHVEARVYPQVLSLRCPAWNSLCGLGSLATEPQGSTCLCVPSTGVRSMGNAWLFSFCMGSGNGLSALSCFLSIPALETGFLNFFFCLLFQSSNLRPRLVLAGVAALEEPHLFRGANGLLEDTLLTQKCLKGVVLPDIALFYDQKSLAIQHRFYPVFTEDDCATSEGLF